MDRKTNRPTRARRRLIPLGILTDREQDTRRRKEERTRRPGPKRGTAATRLGIGLAAALVISACGTGSGTAIPTSTVSAPAVTPSSSATATAECIKNEQDDSCLPIAPDSERVDLVQPSFSNPTNVTNPLFPISQLHSVLMLGHVDDMPFRTEVTLLPETKTIEWNGQPVETLVSQYVAFLDGRIQELAIDWYAQADDGSVWYLGEDVFDYEDGVIISTEGTWLAGRAVPAAMIMPAHPQVGDVFRTENVPPAAFEEVTVTRIDETVNGASGPVSGAIIVSELHQDGTYDDKIFAPGYGEFSTGGGGNLEALALAVPTDALSEPPPAELETLSTGAAGLFDAVQSEDWDAASAAVNTMTTAWQAYRAGDVPDMIEAQMGEALVALAGAIEARSPAETHRAAINVAQTSLDLQLRYRPPAEIDLARFDLWARQVLVDAAVEDTGAVTGAAVTLELIRDRIAHTLKSSDASRIDALLGDLQAAAESEDFAAAADAAGQLRETLAGIEPTSG